MKLSSAQINMLEVLGKYRTGLIEIDIAHYCNPTDYQSFLKELAELVKNDEVTASNTIPIIYRKTLPFIKI